MADSPTIDADDKEVAFLKARITEVVKNGEVQEVESLLRTSVKSRLVVTVEKGTNYSLLHFSCSRGHLAVTRLLLEAGVAAPSAVNKFGKSCLHLAIERVQEETVKLLLQWHGVKEWARKSKLTLGQTASKAGNAEILLLLLKSGLDPNERNSNGETALHYAARYNCPKLIELLMENGAEVGVREHHGGRTPLHYACQAASEK
ncbi:unnamed protein product, partial [Discosporangium mesarthrocarpum]